MRYGFTSPRFLCLVAVLAAGVASAQRPIDEVDRPGSADPPEIVPKGTIQLESGIAFSRESGGSEPRKGTLTLPDLLIRIGVHERFELRLQADGLLYEFRDGAGDRALGSDLAVEAKVALFEQRTLVPETGILVRLSMPVGSDAATSGGFDPSLAGLFQWTLDERTAVVVNTSFAAPTQGHDDDRLFEFGPSVSLDRQITPRLGAFVEYFAAIKSSGAADEHSLGAGLTWFILAKRIQLDLSGGAGLSEAAPEWFVSAGLSLRFDALWAD